ncbi:MAG: Uma2 family endonuclease [Deinococcales bacterium]
MYLICDPDDIPVNLYLEMEMDSEEKYEYEAGRLLAMAGASRAHNRIVLNISKTLDTGACEVFASDMRLRVNDHTFYYPDVLVTCENFKDNYCSTAACVVIEVMSESTAKRDLETKLINYSHLDSLQLYLLVDSRQKKVFGYYQEGERWQLRYFSASEVIPVPCARVELSYDIIYQRSGLS